MATRTQNIYPDLRRFFIYFINLRSPVWKQQWHWRLFKINQQLLPSSFTG